MKVFCHHIYEYQRGLRNLILHTMDIKHYNEVIKKLNHFGIDFLIHKVGQGKMNVYFGDPRCIQIIKGFNKPRLKDLNDQEDFMLGAMLGYNILQQCDRYLNRICNERNIEDLAG